MKIKLIIFFLGVLGFVACSPKAPQSSVQPRFENEIAAFEQQDKENGIIKNEILFVGSSSIRMWTTLKTDMKPLKVLNRGFGGSTTPEVLYYYDKVIKPYSPQVVVIYVGENDIAENQTPEIVAQNVKILIEKIKKEFKEAKIVYLSMKPSILRWKMWDKMQDGNDRIKKMMANKKDCYYLNTADVMLKSEGTPQDDIYIEDGLHMNEKGYAAWTEMVKPLLISFGF